MKAYGRSSPVVTVLLAAVGAVLVPAAVTVPDEGYAALVSVSAAGRRCWWCRPRSPTVAALVSVSAASVGEARSGCRSLTSVMVLPRIGGEAEGNPSYGARTFARRRRSPASVPLFAQAEVHRGTCRGDAGQPVGIPVMPVRDRRQRLAHLRRARDGRRTRPGAMLVVVVLSLVPSPCRSRSPAVAGGARGGGDVTLVRVGDGLDRASTLKVKVVVACASWAGGR